MTNAYSTSRGTRGAIGRVVGAAAAALAAQLLMTTGAAAQSDFCLEREKLVEALDGKYSEKPVAAGLDNAGKLLEIFASGDGATWTMIMTTPGGPSCIVAAGEKWLSQHLPVNDPEA